MGPAGHSCGSPSRRTLTVPQGSQGVGQVGLKGLSQVLGDWEDGKGLSWNWEDGVDHSGFWKWGGRK